MDQSIDKILPRTADDGYSPISVLHEDVLLQIFLANTAMSHTESRLATARLTSHVCRHWRAVMLHSPTIWGRLIDLEVLTANTHDWMREVISRRGSALLWINGPIVCGRISEDNEPPTPEFILTLISENWSRIQRLDIAVVFQDVGNEDEAVYAQYWTTLLKRPAPRLAELAFDYRLEPYYSRSRRSPSWNPPALLFDYISPVLRKVRIYRTAARRATEQQSADDRPEDLPLGMPVSWLSRLRFLSLRSAYKWDTFQLMRLLNATPFLEELEVFHVSTENLKESDVQVIRLPQLKRFHFQSCYVLDLVVLLESISPSSRCCLGIARAFYPDSSHDLLSESEGLPYMHKFYSLVMKYVDAYFHQNKATNVVLGYHTYQLFQVVDQTPLRQDEPSERAHQLSISIPLKKRYAYHARNTLAYSTLFSSVEYLDIHDWWAEHEDWSIWLSAFDSVTTLIASADNIHRMMQDRYCRGPELPRLRVLRIGRPTEWPLGPYNVDSYYARTLPKFFRRRKEVGLPVAVLDLTVVKPYKLCDLDGLEEFDGLLVRWMSFTGDIKEYVCGSGRPEELRFAKGYRSVCVPLPRVPPEEPDKMFGWSGHL